MLGKMMTGAAQPSAEYLGSGGSVWSAAGDALEQMLIFVQNNALLCAGVAAGTIVVVALLLRRRG